MSGNVLDAVKDGVDIGSKEMTKKQIQSRTVLNRAVKAINKQADKASKYDPLRAKLEKAKEGFQSIINISQEEKIKNFAEQTLKEL